MKWTSNLLIVTAAITICCIALPAFCAASNTSLTPESKTNSSDQMEAAAEPVKDKELPEDDITVPTKTGIDYKLETVASFDNYMPRGVAVTKDGRIFVCFPRHDPDHTYTVAEVKGKKVIPF